MLQLKAANVLVGAEGNVSMRDARALAQRALACDSAEAARALVRG